VPHRTHSALCPGRSEGAPWDCSQTGQIRCFSASGFMGSSRRDPSPVPGGAPRAPIRRDRSGRRPCLPGSNSASRDACRHEKRLVGLKALVLGPVSRILSATVLRWRDLHFSQAARRRSASWLPGLRPAPRDATNPGLSDGPPSPLFSLAPDWVFRAAVVASGAVGSYPTFSPLPV